MVSILMLTHNAPEYCKESIKTLQMTQGVPYELIVVDNASDKPTQKVVKRLYNKNMIQKIALLNENLLFARGNNVAAAMSSAKSQYVLLLNSDVCIKRADWLEQLIALHKEKTGRGATGFGYCDNEPQRADGYCLLMDRDLYLQYRLDESFEWWWSVTKIQAMLMRDGHKVTAVKDHEKYLHHYGKKSGTDWQGAKGMDVDSQEVLEWFANNKISTVETV